MSYGMIRDGVRSITDLAPERLQKLLDKRAAQIAPNQGAIPEALKAIPHWVSWRLEYDERDRFTKVPYFSPGLNQPASSTAPSTWSSFEVAWKHYDERKKWRVSYEGVGFVMKRGDNLVGIDLDKCVSPEGVIAPWALEVLESLRCYAELSPSGSGIRGYVRSTLPENHFSKTNTQKGEVGFEIYDQCRFLTVTGKRLVGSPEDIPEVDPAVVLELHDKMFATRLAEQRLAEEKSRLAREAVARLREERLARGEKVVPGDEWGSAWTVATRRGLVEDIMASSEGTRHNAIYSAAARAGSLIAGGAPGLEGIEVELVEAGMAAGKGAREVERTVRDGLAHGMRQPAAPPQRRPGKVAQAAAGIALAVGLAGGVVNRIAQYIGAPDDNQALAVLTTARQAVTQPAQEAEPPWKDRLDAIRNKQRKLAREVAWASLADPILADKPRRTMIVYAQCFLRAVGRCCLAPGGCKHASATPWRCGREACPFCINRGHINHWGSFKELLAGVDKGLLERGETPEGWYLHHYCGNGLKEVLSAHESLRRKMSARAKTMTRIVRAPEGLLVLTRDGGIVEELQRLTGDRATRVTRLESFEQPLLLALKRRRDRVLAMLNDYARVLAEANHQLVPVGQPPTPMSDELAARLRAHEFRAWLGRCPISTSGESAEIPWPDSESLREYARKQAQLKREEKGLPLLDGPDDCPEHGSVYLGKYELVNLETGQRTVLPVQPELGRRPTRKQALAADPVLAAYG